MGVQSYTTDVNFSFLSIKTNTKETYYITSDCLKVTFNLLKRVQKWLRNEITIQFLNKLIENVAIFEDMIIF